MKIFQPALVIIFGSSDASQYKFYSPQVKRNLMSNIKGFVYVFRQELANNLRC